MDAHKEILKTIIESVKEVYNVDISKQEKLILSKLEDPKDVTVPGLTLPCFILTKFIKPKEKKVDFKSFVETIAKSLHSCIEKKLKDSKCFKQVSVTGPYLNFSFTSWYLGQLIQLLRDNNLRDVLPEQQERIMIEYSQPNTHKVFHVGHMRNASLGMSLVKMFEFMKYKVVAVNYIGDVGAHIAKCLWYYLRFYPKKNDNIDNIEDNIPKGMSHIEFLGDCYSKACVELDFTRWTKFPFPGWITTKVLKVEEHPKEKKWLVAKVTDGKKEYTVVSGGKGFKENDIVAYAPVGSVKGGRTVGTIDKKGVVSEGCILSEKELTVSDNNDKIYVFPPETKVGDELTEIGRKKDIDLPPEIKIADEMKKRKKEVNDILKRMEEKEPEITKLWKITRDWSINDFKEIYKWTDCRFDYYFHESDVGDESKQMVLDLYEKGVLKKSEGTIGIDLGKKLGWCMLLTSAGNGLYATKDLALAKRKFEEFKIDRSIYVVDMGQTLHFQQVFATLEKIGFKQAKKCYHLAYGLVTLPEGKMSSRKGTIIPFSALKKQLINSIMEQYLNKYLSNPDWTKAEINEAARRIAVAVIKYGMLKQDTSSDIVFDLKEWTAKTGNTGPYLMYAYARTRAILRRVGFTEEDKKLIDYTLLTHEKEIILLGAMNQFIPTVKRAVEQYKPHIICGYLYDLCKEFSRFYENVDVKNSPTPALKATRLALVDAFGLLVKQGLDLLGIQTLERM